MNQFDVDVLVCLPSGLQLMSKELYFWLFQKFEKIKWSFFFSLVAFRLFQRKSNVFHRYEECSKGLRMLETLKKFLQWLGILEKFI